MSSQRAVILSPRARWQAAAVQAWWLENRPAASALFEDELGAAIADLQCGRVLGVVYGTIRSAQVFRVLLPRSRYHVYYRFGASGGAVEIVAVWHTSRGRAPSL
jgi:plasmid stabilization system protein ParE